MVEANTDIPWSFKFVYDHPGDIVRLNDIACDKIK